MYFSSSLLYDFTVPRINNSKLCLRLRLTDMLAVLLCRWYLEKECRMVEEPKSHRAQVPSALTSTLELLKSLWATGGLYASARRDTHLYQQEDSFIRFAVDSMTHERIHSCMEAYAFLNQNSHEEFTPFNTYNFFFFLHNFKQMINEQSCLLWLKCAHIPTGMLFNNSAQSYTHTLSNILANTMFAKVRVEIGKSLR